MSRSEASRINGAKSRGPVTPAGKARSSRNAITHGLTARDLCLSTEDEAKFNVLQAAYFDKFQPQDQVEADLINEMVAAKWRQQRLWNIETADLDFGIGSAREQTAGANVPPALLTALAANEDNKPLELYARYEARLSCIYNRALRNLRELRCHPIPAPAVVEVEEPVQNEPETPQIESAPVQNEPEPPKDEAKVVELPAPNAEPAPPQDCAA